MQYTSKYKVITTEAEMQNNDICTLRTMVVQKQEEKTVECKKQEAAHINNH